MSCRHDLANGTCLRCYPTTGKIAPGPEDDYEENLEGPGAIPVDAYRQNQKETKNSKGHVISVRCSQPNCIEEVLTWSQCPLQNCALNVGFCRSHGGQSSAEDLMRAHIQGHDSAHSTVGGT